MKRFLLSIISLIFATSIFSQSGGYIGSRDSSNVSIDTNKVYQDSYISPVVYEPPVFEANVWELASGVKDVLKTVINDFKVVQIDLEGLSNHVNTNNYFSQFYLSGIDSVDHLFEIQVNDLRASNYKEVYKGLIGQSEVAKNISDPVYTYKGFLDGYRENIVRLTVSPNEFSGYLYIKSLDKWLYIEPIRKTLASVDNILAGTVSQDLFVVYELTDILTQTDLKCGVEIADTTIIVSSEASGDSGDECLPLTLEIATDADYEYFQRYGSNTNGTILSILNQVEGIYSANFNIIFSVTYQNVWQRSSDPYTSTDGEELLYQFRNYWNSNVSGVPRDISHLFTGKNIDGSTIGITFTETLCKNNSIAYGLSQDYNSGTFGKIGLTAHEIGHHFEHDHIGENCSGNGSIMCSTAQGGAFYFSDTERNVFSSYIDNYGSCLENDNIQNVSGHWLKTWTNDRNKKRLGTWNFNNGDRVLTGDFDGNGTEEFLFVSNSASWCSMVDYRCGYGSDWYHMWSNMGTRTIGTWFMNVGDKYYTGDFDGDGKTDLLSISANRSWATLHGFENGNFQFKWSNMGNRRISSWYVNYSDRFEVGDFDGDGKDELLSFSTGGWSMINNFEGSSFTSTWSNNGNGLIGGVNLRSSNYYSVGEYRGDNVDELFAIDGKWATFIRFNNQTNSWDWRWSNYGGNSVSGWGLPLNSGDYILSDNFDSDQKDELIFIQSGSQASWATTMDFNSDGNLQWNWSNYGNGLIADWKQKGSDNYFHIKNISEYTEQVLAINVISHTTGWWLWENTTYEYQASMYRPTFPENNNLVVQDNFDQVAEEYNSELTAVSEKTQPVQFVVYPNPSDGVISIRFNTQVDASVTIYDATGRLVKEDVAKNGEIFINLENQPKGSYLLKIMVDSEVATKQIILK